MNALVLSAGLGSRLGDVTRDIPKPMLPISGRPVLEWNLRLLRHYGFTDVWINLHHRPDAVRTHFGDGAKFGLRIRYSFESTLLGTAGAAKKLEGVLGDPFLVVYGDNLLRCNIEELVVAQRANGAVVCIGVFDQGQHTNTGLAGGRAVMDSSGWISDFVEQGTLASPWVNAGIYVCSLRSLAVVAAGQPADFAKDVFPALLSAQERLLAHPIEGFCLAIDTPDAYRRAQGMWERLSGEEGGLA